ncbi:MAG: DUF6807 family protein [Tepidisphaeraceae bacterium]
MLIGVSFASAQTKLTIDAGEVARGNSPVAARIEGANVAAGGVTLVDAGGKEVEGQVNVEAGGVAMVRWIEPELAAGKSRTYAIQKSETNSQGFRFKDGDGVRDLLYGNTPVWRDMIKYDPADHANTFKPFQHIYAPGGGEGDFITKGADGKYPHHRGIFFGFKAHDGDNLLGDFWHCPDVSQRHVKYLTEAEFVGPIAARCAAVTDWIGKDGKTAVVRDTRTETTWRVSPDTLLLDYEISIESLIGKPIKLEGDAHHAGFHFRAAQEVAQTKGVDGKEGSATYLRPATAKHMGNDIWSDCAWTICAFDVKGKHYEVTLLDHQSNPRPTTFSTRPYGRFGAFFTADVQRGSSLRVRYRVIIRSGEASAGGTSRAEAASQDFAKVKAGSVKH